MPIPAFDAILNVLPPHLGDPRDPSSLSPYACTIQEMCQHFATSDKRREILRGFLRLRAELFNLGIQGFHWLDGSFLENIEAHESRDPEDLDVVTFVAAPADPMVLRGLVTGQQPLLDRDYVKANYSVDLFLIPLGSAPDLLVDQSRYWYGLFSHRRDGVWKGMLLLELLDQTQDAVARAALGVTS